MDGHYTEGVINKVELNQLMDAARRHHDDNKWQVLYAAVITWGLRGVLFFLNDGNIFLHDADALTLTLTMKMQDVVQ